MDSLSCASSSVSSSAAQQIFPNTCAGSPQLLFLIDVHSRLDDVSSDKCEKDVVVAHAPSMSRKCRECGLWNGQHTKLLYVQRRGRRTYKKNTKTDCARLYVGLAQARPNYVYISVMQGLLWSELELSIVHVLLAQVCGYWVQRSDAFTFAKDILYYPLIRLFSIVKHSYVSEILRDCTLQIIPKS